MIKSTKMYVIVIGLLEWTDHTCWSGVERLTHVPDSLYNSDNIEDRSLQFVKRNPLERKFALIHA